MTTEKKDKIFDKAIEAHSTPFGKPNPQTYAFIEGYKLALKEDAAATEWKEEADKLREALNNLLPYCQSMRDEFKIAKAAIKNYDNKVNIKP